MLLEDYEAQSKQAITSLLEVANLQEGDIVVVGCSTSEIAGKKIGTAPGVPVGAAVLAGILPVLRENGLYLAAQCCEHLERALVVARACMQQHALQQVNAVPQPKAGGSFATAAFGLLQDPVLVQGMQAAAGLDIGNTLIGMHLRPVVVPVRLCTRAIGEAPLVAARTRLRFVGGPRAEYDPELF